MLVVACLSGVSRPSSLVVVVVLWLLGWLVVSPLLCLAVWLVLLLLWWFAPVSLSFSLVCPVVVWWCVSWGCSAAPLSCVREWDCCRRWRRRGEAPVGVDGPG